MKKYWRRKKTAMYSQVLMVMLLVFVVTGSVVMSQHRRDGSEEVPVISLKLSAVKESVCKGSAINVQAEVTNLGETSVSIDPESVWYRASFDYNNPSVNGIGDGASLTIVGDPGSNAKRSFVEILPGKSYKQSRVFAIDDKLLKEAGTFEMSITYGQFRKADDQAPNLFVGTVASNKVQFTQRICRSSKRSK